MNKPIKEEKDIQEKQEENIEIVEEKEMQEGKVVV